MKLVFKVKRTGKVLFTTSVDKVPNWQRVAYKDKRYGVCSLKYCYPEDYTEVTLYELRDYHD